MGLNSTHAIKQVAYHFYEGKFGRNETLGEYSQGLITHTDLVNSMVQFIPDINYLQANHPGVPFLLDEVAVSMGYGTGKPPAQLANNLASAIWNVDFQLHSMAINVTRVNLQQILAAG